MTEALTPHERKALRDVLAPFAQNISRVAVFGSRATGEARPNSDIDLVVYGDIDEKMERRLWTLFEDSNLPVAVDVVAYPSLSHPALKAHIDKVAVTIFTKEDLLSVA